jgi:DNA-directed RNA polymerase subunit RPC12/RpoP
MENANLYDTEFICRRCGKTFSAIDYNSSRFCTNCGTFLQLRPQPKHWLFQFNPAIYRWLDRIKETQEPEQWLVSQHANHIREGDMAAIWASGEKAGVYAIGQIITNPRQKALDPQQEKYWLKKDDIRKFQEKPSVIIKYLKITCSKPLLQQQCRSDETLSTMQVFMNPQGTNFPLTKAQWHRLLELIAQNGTQT